MKFFWEKDEPKVIDSNLAILEQQKLAFLADPANNNFVVIFKLDDRGIVRSKPFDAIVSIYMDEDLTYKLYTISGKGPAKQYAMTCFHQPYIETEDNKLIPISRIREITVEKI